MPAWRNNKKISPECPLTFKPRVEQAMLNHEVTLSFLIGGKPFTATLSVCDETELVTNELGEICLTCPHRSSCTAKPAVTAHYRGALKSITICEIYSKHLDLSSIRLQPTT